MPDILNPRVLACLRSFGWAAGLGALLLGSLVLVGWHLGNQTLVTVGPGLAAMSPVTASAFIIAGLSLTTRKLGRSRLAGGAAALLVAMSTVVLLGYIAVGHGVLNPLVNNRFSDAAGSLRGRTAPATACGFLILSIAMLALGRAKRRDEWIVVVCSAFGLLISALALLGYAYGVDGLYGTKFYHTTAVHTAAGLFVLFLACFLHDPERGWPAIIASGLPSGAATRGQLLLTTLLPFVIGLLVLHVIRSGSLAPSLGMDRGRQHDGANRAAYPG